MWGTVGVALLGLIATTGVAQGIDILTRLEGIPVSSLLFHRGLFGIMLLLLLFRPRQKELWPRRPRIALMRLASSGLTFAGWFGAIAYLSAPVATALMLLDCIVLAAIKSARINVRASTAEWALSLSLVAYVVAIWQVSPVTTGHIVIGSAAAGAAILARAASMHLWQVGTEIGEVAFHRIAIPLAGGFLAGLFGSGGIPSFVGVYPTFLILGTAALGVIGYMTTDFLVGRLGAYRARLIDVLAVPVLAVFAVRQPYDFTVNVVAALAVMTVSTCLVVTGHFGAYANLRCK